MYVYIIFVLCVVLSVFKNMFDQNKKINRIDKRCSMKHTQKTTTHSHIKLLLSRIYSSLYIYNIEYDRKSCLSHIMVSGFQNRETPHHAAVSMSFLCVCILRVFSVSENEGFCVLEIFFLYIRVCIKKLIQFCVCISVWCVCFMFCQSIVVSVVDFAYVPCNVSRCVVLSVVFSVMINI